jgi:hypothetical protein
MVIGIHTCRIVLRYSIGWFSITLALHSGANHDDINRHPKIYSHSERQEVHPRVDNGSKAGKGDDPLSFGTKQPKWT